MRRSKNKSKSKKFRSQSIKRFMNTPKGCVSFSWHERGYFFHERRVVYFLCTDLFYSPEFCLHGDVIRSVWVFYAPLCFDTWLLRHMSAGVSSLWYCPRFCEVPLDIHSNQAIGGGLDRYLKCTSSPSSSFRQREWPCLKLQKSRINTMRQSFMNIPMFHPKLKRTSWIRLYLNK